jgi:hypothetical protein
MISATLVSFELPGFHHHQRAHLVFGEHFQRLKYGVIRANEPKRGAAFAEQF